MAEPRKITINPISRLEGHGKVVIHLDEKGEVEGAQFHVTQFRGYERFCEGRPFEEMPVITQRICGICPVSHQLASAKACDAILGVEIPETARLLRELEHMGQFIQSHALHFFYLASPDLLLGWDSDPAKRNVVGVIGAFPDVAKKGIRLRKFGQDIIKALGGKKVHPAYAVPGGVMKTETGFWRALEKRMKQRKSGSTSSKGGWRRTWKRSEGSPCIPPITQD
jgi:NAD-reducing hydrogenase large subunit